MNKQHKTEHTINFTRQWLDVVLSHCRRMRGFLLHLRTKGHLNPRYTSLDDKIMLDVETFLRIEVNLSMVMDRDEYFKHWTEMGTMIYEFANEYGDEFNKIYETKKTEH